MDQHLTTINELEVYPNGETRAPYVQAVLRNFSPDKYSARDKPIVMRFWHAAVGVANEKQQVPNLTAGLRKLYEAMLCCLAIENLSG